MIEFLHISYAGPTHKIIDPSGKEWLFEMHRYCGPIPLNKKTQEPMKREPREKSIFWQVVTWWAQQGQKVENGYCIYEKPCPEIIVDIHGIEHEVEAL